MSNSYSLKDSRYCAIDVEELVLGCLILNDTFFDYRLEENDFSRVLPILFPDLSCNISANSTQSSGE